MSDSRSSLERLNIGHYFLIFLIVVSLFLCWQIMRPYIDAVIIALILAALTSPANEWIARQVGGRKNLAAMISCLLLTLIIVVPVVTLLSIVIRQGILSLGAIQGWIEAGNLNHLMDNPTIKGILDMAGKYLPGNLLKNLDPASTVMQHSALAGRWLVSRGGYFIGNLSMVAGKFLIMIFVFFFAELMPVPPLMNMGRTRLSMMPITTIHHRAMNIPYPQDPESAR